MMARTSAMAIVLVALLYGACYAADEWIWRDRWNQMGKEFHTGYIAGVDDLVGTLAVGDVLLDTLKSGGVTNHLQGNLRLAHICANKFDTIKSGVEFAQQAMSK